MITHLRARALQAGAFLALIGGVLLVAPSAASAADPTVTLTGAPASMPSGGQINMNYKITDSTTPPPTAPIKADVVISASGTKRCDGCGSKSPTLPADGSFSVTAPDVAAGEKVTIQVEVSATTTGEGGGTATASKTITVVGPDKPQTVSRVSGRVKDQEGKAVSGALVGLQDSKGQQFQTTTNGDGRYSFISSDAKPIATGSLFVGVAKDGYITTSVKAQGAAGKSVNVPLTIKSSATPSPSNSPSPTPSASAAPVDEATDEASEPATENSAAVLDAAPKSGTDKDSGSMLYIILGGLLVAAGIGAIVLVIMRRKSNEDAEESSAAGAGGAVPAAAPAGQFDGGADQTRLAAPVGARGNDATMIAPRSGAPSMADAPTMIQQAPPPPVDEFPDPYGAPMPPGGGYNAPGGWGTAGAAGAAGAYGAAPGAPGYGTATQFGGAPVPAQHGGYAEQDDHGYAGNGYGTPQAAGYPDQAGYDQAGYGAEQGGYDQSAQRYDEPTGMYRPEQDGGYPPEAGYHDQAGYGGAEQAYGQNEAYAQGANDYADQAHAAPYQGEAYGAPADQNAYGGWGGAGGDIDSGNAYGPPAAGGTYGGAPQGGGTYGGQNGAQAYGAPPAGTYGAPAGGGYVDPAGAPDNGYGGDQAGYDPQSAYGQPQGYDQHGQQPQGGYGDQGGYAPVPDQNGYYGGQQQGGQHGGPPRQQPPHGGHPVQRRPNEWAED